MRGRLKKRLTGIFIILIVCLLLIGGFLGWATFSKNAVHLKNNTFLYIPKGAIYSDVLDSLDANELLNHPKNFNEIAQVMNYPKNVHSGRYKLSPEMSNFELIQLLRSGKQTPVKLVINKERTKADMAQLLSSELAPDSTDFMHLFNDTNFLKQYHFNTQNVLCAIIPNTYQFFWDTDAKSTYKRLVKERNKFWTADRKAQADSLGLTPNEAYILASIVTEESNDTEEMPLIASVYLNRLKIGMALRADPTIKFALKNFALKRITWDDLEVKSPYNTYLHKGLPPGPICTPSIKTIDAVLKAPKTSYLYFTAKADFSGSHVFEKTYTEHLRNARAYHRALDKLDVE